LGSLGALADFVRAMPSDRRRRSARIRIASS